MIENQPNYYDACKVKLYTKYDDASDTSGSCGLITRRKDLHAPVKNDVYYPASGTNDRDGVAERPSYTTRNKRSFARRFARTQPSLERSSFWITSGRPPSSMGTSWRAQITS